MGTFPGCTLGGCVASPGTLQVSAQFLLKVSLALQWHVGGRQLPFKNV